MSSTDESVVGRDSSLDSEQSSRPRDLRADVSAAGPGTFGRHLRRAYSACGLLPLLAILMTGAALWIHHAADSLPGPYTVLEPLRTLRSVVALPGFMLAALAAFCVGRLRRRGEWQVDAIRAAFTQQVSISRVLPGLKRRAQLAAIVLVLDAIVLDGQSPLDFLALGVLVFAVGEQRRTAVEWLRLGAYGVVASLVFMAICYSYTVLKALTFVGSAQVDAQIVAVERAIFGVTPHRVVASWAARHPDLVALLDWVYFRFFHHMALTTVLLVALRLGKERTEYLGALAICYVIGGPLYHLWPGAGPGYFEPSYFEFLRSQPLLVNSIRAWLYQNTYGVVSGRASVLQTWGYVACMPSLHVAQEIVMLYYARHSRVAFLVSSAFAALTLVSVVALGWHYPLDSVAGGVVAALAIKVAHWQRDALMPSFVNRQADEALPLRRPVLAQMVSGLRRAALSRVSGGQ